MEDIYVANKIFFYVCIVLWIIFQIKSGLQNVMNVMVICEVLFVNKYDKNQRTGLKTKLEK